MTTADKIAGLEKRIAEIQGQQKRLLQVASTEAQKQAVSIGHELAVGEIQERIDILKRGEPDPWE